MKMEKGQIAKPSPYVRELDPGIYYWCACGRSESQPFCDGSHLSTPNISVEMVIREKKKVILCGCKQSGAAPFCDGTHRKF